MNSEHLTTDHTSDPISKTGILVANLGTPDGYDYWSMRRYLNEFLSDKRVVDLPDWKWQPILQGIILTRRPFTSGANYRLIWNNEQDESPLLTITRNQTNVLRSLAHAEWGDKVMVEFCMRYGNPSTHDVLDRMIEAGCRRIVFLPLYPQYAGATSATANDQLFRELMKQKWQPAVRTCEPYFNRPDYIRALAESVRSTLNDRIPGRLVASYHGMPRRYYTEGDPYYDQCLETSRLLQNALGWPDGSIDTSFQSVFGREEWLRPYTVEHVAELARKGVNNIAVISPAFSADCIETLEEINGEIRESFEHAGGTSFTYISCLNDTPAHIGVLLNIIRENIGGWV